MEKETSIEELVNQPIKNIVAQNGNTIINFENNQQIVLKGEPFEMEGNCNIERCSFCGKPKSNEYPLFTVDDSVYICKECVLLAYKTFLQNGIDLPQLKDDKNE